MSSVETVGFTDELVTRARELVARYPQPRSALLPLLHLVQSHDGYVSDAGMGLCAQLLDLTRAEVQAVATFYTMYKREPVGDWLVSVCTNVSCKVAGGERIYQRYLEQLGGHHDGEVTVEHVECLGICDAAPAVQVNYEMYGRLDDETADALLASCRDGSLPVALSGEVPRTFREVERELSGADDGSLHAPSVVASANDLTAPTPPDQRLGETTTRPLVPPGPEREDGEAGVRPDGPTGDQHERYAGGGDEPEDREQPSEGST